MSRIRFSNIFRTPLNNNISQVAAIFLCILSCIIYYFYVTTLSENTTLLSQYKSLRKQYGALSCKCNGIGPSGGFCLNKDKYKVGGNDAWCRNLAQELRRLFHGQSVYDFGAGLGWYGKALIATGSDGYHIAEYEAFDGAENIEEIFPDGFVKYKDLSQPFSLPPKDWVLSFEVGEHIPMQYEKTFIENLHRHNKKGIVLSWAVEGQGGHFHVNGRSNEYIKDIFKHLGYTSDVAEENRLRNVSTLYWFKNTLMVFRKHAH